MTTPVMPPAGRAPSRRTLLATTLVAAVIAIVLLVTTILPAEYGVDLIGTGRLLGLTAIAEPPPAAAAAPPPAGRASPLSPLVEGPVAHHGVPFRADSTTLVLDPYQYVEYKYRLEKGATMLYSWTASSQPIYDFHSESDGLMPKDGSAPPGPTSFDKKPKREASGAFTAPFTGIHGWYWENPGGETLTISLTSAGFYATATEFRSPRVRRGHDLTTLDQLVFPPAQDPSPVPR